MNVGFAWGWHAASVVLAGDYGRSFTTVPKKAQNDRACIRFVRAQCILEPGGSDSYGCVISSVNTEPLNPS